MSENQRIIKRQLFSKVSIYHLRFFTQVKQANDLIDNKKSGVAQATF